MISTVTVIGLQIIARLSFELESPGSSLGRTSTQGLKIIEEKGGPLHWHQKMVKF